MTELDIPDRSSNCYTIRTHVGLRPNYATKLLYFSRAPVDQSVASQAVNLVVVSLNPSSVHILLYTFFLKSL